MILIVDVILLIYDDIIYMYKHVKKQPYSTSLIRSNIKANLPSIVRERLTDHCEIIASVFHSQITSKGWCDYQLLKKCMLQKTHCIIWS